MIIRAFQPEDYPAVVALHNTIWDDNPKTPDQLAEDDAGREAPFRRFVAEQEGMIRAFLSYEVPHWAYTEGKLFLRMGAAHDAWHDSGRALYIHALNDLRQYAPHTLTIAMRESQAAALAMLNALGFRVELHEVCTELDVQRFDPAPFQPSAEKAQVAGIRIATIDELSAEDPDWQRKWWRLLAQIEADVPSVDPLTPPPFEKFLRWLEQTMIRSSIHSIAVETASQTWVGQTGLLRVPAAPTQMLTALTGVLPDYRRKGIATALKLHSIAYARAQGIHRLMTKNEQENPMLDLNLMLGFQVIPGYLELECTVKPLEKEPVP